MYPNMMKKKIYLASSWRNEFQPRAVMQLREAGYEVYDFRNPPHGCGGFQWSKIDEGWQDWTPEEYRQNLSHPIADAGFKSDYDAMLECDICVMLLPCGRSAHAEAGWFAGAGRKVYVVCPVKQEPELMYKLFDGVFVSVEELIKFLKES